jgi:hypothetical protein
VLARGEMGGAFRARCTPVLAVFWGWLCLNGWGGRMALSLLGVSWDYSLVAE